MVFPAKPNQMREHAAANIGSNFHKLGTLVGTDAVEAPLSTTVIPATAHSVTADDLLMFFTGDEESEPKPVASVTSATITLSEALSGTPSDGEEFVFLSPDETDACEAATTDTIIVVTAYTCSAGDLFWMLDGDEIGEMRIIGAAGAGYIVLDAPLSGTPTPGETFATTGPRVNGAAVESGTTDTIITDADHTAAVGDIFMMKTGGEIDQLRVVTAVTASTFTLNEALSGTPSAAETYSLWTQTGSDAVEDWTSTTTLGASAHAAQVGDEIVMTSGTYDGVAREVTAVSTNVITVEASFGGTPAASDTFSINRPIAMKDGVVWMKLENQTNQPLLISFDGSTSFARLAASGDELELRLHEMGRKLGNDRSTPAIGTKGYVYAKVESTAPTSGSLYVSEIS